LAREEVKVNQLSSKNIAKFTRLDQSTKEDWEVIMGYAVSFADGLVDRVIGHINELDGSLEGMPVNRLEHCLQMATMCFRAGKSEEYVVCALLHDIGDTLGSYNHAEIAAAILQPFISDENYWIVKHHAIFQGYYFFHHLGLDRNMRDQFRGHPYFHACEEFCRLDQAAFNPNYDSMTLEEFEPMLRRVFSKPVNTIYPIENSRNEG